MYCNNPIVLLVRGRVRLLSVVIILLSLLLSQHQSYIVRNLLLIDLICRFLVLKIYEGLYARMN